MIIANISQYGYCILKIYALNPNRLSFTAKMQIAIIHLYKSLSSICNSNAVIFINCVSHRQAFYLNRENRKRILFPSYYRNQSYIEIKLLQYRSPKILQAVCFYGSAYVRTALQTERLPAK